MSDTENTTTSTGARRAPTTVRAAVVILGLLALSDVASLVQALIAAPASGADIAVGIAETVIRVAISLLLARLLWRGSNTGRVVIVVLHALAIVFYAVSVAVDGLGPVDLYLAWTAAEMLLVVALIALMFVADTRRWCTSSREQQRASRPEVPADRDEGPGAT